jgi:signal transduction histidine kinase
MCNFADMLKLTGIYRRLCLTTVFIALCLTMSGYTDHRNTRVDSALQVLKSGRKLTDKERMDCYYQIVRGTLGKDSKMHDDYCHKMLALSYRMDAKNMRENAFYHLGLQHYGREEYEAAERYFKMGLAVTDSMRGDKRYPEQDVDDNLSQLYGALGNLYNLQDKALLAIEYYQKALPIFEKYGWQQSQTVLHHNVAELWLSMGNNQKAEQEYLRAIEAGEASGDSLMIALPRKGLVKIYIDEGNYEKAVKTAMPAYRYYRHHRQEERSDYAEMLASMAKIHLMDGHEDMPRAKAFASEALSLDDDELMFETRGEINSAAALVAMKERNWKQALHYALKTVHERDEDATYSDVSCYRLLADIYTELGEKAKAREYINKVYQMMERFATDHYQSGLSQMEVVYETEKKEAQIDALAKEQRLYFWLLTASAGIVLMLIALVIIRHIAHQRQKALLAARVALETETKERRILARDLHDSLGGMLSLLRLKIEAEDDDVLPLLDATHTELRRVSHHLMPEELLRNGLASSLHDFAVSVPGSQFHAIGDIRLSKEMELTLYRCAYELVNNAMKHAQAKHIDIQLMQTDGEVTLTVSDDGKGIGNNGGGMGLQNIRERIEPYRGALRIVSNEHDGTEINVTLPL